MLINQRPFLASWLSLCLLVNGASSIERSNETISDDKVLSEQEARNLINNKLEQLSLIVHRKSEGDRIRKKRQFDSNYFLPGEEGLFILLKLIANFNLLS